jgi:carbon starvation protein
VSPWATFTVFATLPIAMLMGVYMRHLRPGRILEVSGIGFVLLLLSVWAGGWVSTHQAWAVCFTFNPQQLAWILIGYGAFASILPVWFVLAPRDYLSTFLKIGTVVLLAVAIALVAPPLQMPAVTRFIDGTGPVFAGALFPFLFITIACGAVSGFHALVASGTTPKMLDRETDARAIGYGGMLMESFVAIMALVAAAALQPGIYFAMNSPAALIGTTAASAAQTISGWGFSLTPDQVQQAAQSIGESSILSRAGGAPTLAMGMAGILRNLLPGPGMMAFWYHYAILFEALFILTTLDAGTRIGRFMVQDLLGSAYAPLRRTESWVANVLCTALCVAGWGFFLYQGVVDPMGGINSLWPLFGISNQMLAGIALLFATTTLVKMKRERMAWVTGVPMVWLLVSTLTAGYLKVFSSDPHIGFLVHAARYSQALAENHLLAPAKSMAQMQAIVRNDHIDAAMALLFMTVVVIVAVLALRAAVRAWGNAVPTSVDTGDDRLPAV